MIGPGEHEEHLRTPLENYNHYNACLTNNTWCPATPGWEKKRAYYSKIIEDERNTISNLKSRVTNLEGEIMNKKEPEKACAREDNSKPINSFYGENLKIKRKDEDKCQLALECVISDIEDCAKELKAIDYLQNRSVSYSSMCIDYFKDNRKIDLYSRRQQLLDLILTRTKELVERVL